MVEDDVKRVAKAICYANCLSAHPTDIERAQCQAENGWDLWILEARAAITAMQSPGIPILDLPQADIDEFVEKG